MEKPRADYRRIGTRSWNRCLPSSPLCPISLRPPVRPPAPFLFAILSFPNNCAIDIDSFPPGVTSVICKRFPPLKNVRDTALISRKVRERRANAVKGSAPFENCRVIPKHQAQSASLGCRRDRGTNNKIKKKNGNAQRRRYCKFKDKMCITRDKSQCDISETLETSCCSAGTTSRDISSLLTHANSREGRPRCTGRTISEGREFRLGEAEKRVRQAVPEKCEMCLTGATFALVRFSS